MQCLPELGIPISAGKGIPIYNKVSKGKIGSKAGRSTATYCEEGVAGALFVRFWAKYLNSALLFG